MTKFEQKGLEIRNSTKEIVLDFLKSNFCTAENRKGSNWLNSLDNVALIGVTKNTLLLQTSNIGLSLVYANQKMKEGCKKQ